MRAIAVLLALLPRLLASPISAAAADGRGWQGWAFEVRGDGSSVWVGAWEQRLCEGFRRDAMEGRYQEAGIESFSQCLPVTITDEPPGAEAWLAPLHDDDHQLFVAGPAEVCEGGSEDRSAVFRKVAFEPSRCQRVWIRVAV